MPLKLLTLTNARISVPSFCFHIVMMFQSVADVIHFGVRTVQS